MLLYESPLTYEKSFRTYRICKQIENIQSLTTQKINQTVSVMNERYISMKLTAMNRILNIYRLLRMKNNQQ